MILFDRKRYRKYRENITFRGHLKNMGLIIGPTLLLVVTSLIVLILCSEDNPKAWIILVGGPIIGGFLAFSFRYILGIPFPYEALSYYKNKG